MEAAERVFEEIEKYRNELRTQIKGMESKLNELKSSVPLAKQVADAELRKIAEALTKEKAVLEEAVIPLREQKAVMDRQLNDAREAFQAFIAQKSDRIQEVIGQKNLELNSIVNQLDIAQARLIQITASIVKAKEDIARL